MPHLLARPPDHRPVLSAPIRPDPLTRAQRNSNHRTPGTTNSPALVATGSIHVDFHVANWQVIDAPDIRIKPRFYRNMVAPAETRTPPANATGIVRFAYTMALLCAAVVAAAFLPQPASARRTV